MFEDLRWFGIEWEEGPDRGGPCRPYAQSERHDALSLRELRRQGYRPQALRPRADFKPAE